MSLGLTQFPARLLKRVAFEPNSGCWLWTGALSNGYANARWHGRIRKVHVIFYEIAHGPMPEGLESDHLCRVRNCVNPAHIEPVTRSVNQKRGLMGVLAKPRTKGWHNPGSPYGEKHGNAKLTNQDVAEIRAASGMTQRELAEKYGVCPPHISDILNRKRRKKA